MVEFDAKIGKMVMTYYLRPEIVEKMFAVTEGREVIPVFRGNQFGKRPSTVQFPGDLEYMIKKGATSFHCSLEHWSNPLALSSSSKKQEMDELRTGWDIFFDIDANEDVEHGRITAKLIIWALRVHGIENISVKFSGRRGFHVAVAFEALPPTINFTPVAKMHPELLQKIADYLRDFIREKLVEELLVYDVTLKDRMKGDPYSIIEVEHNWSYRHLFRMPYSFNEKTWNVSLPIPADKLDEFKIEDAKPENVIGDIGFLDSYKKNEAAELVMEALDYDARMSEMRAREDESASKQKKTGYVPREAVPVEFFPPCIMNIFKGIPDGRKRASFILINFLKSVGWTEEMVDEKVMGWNRSNPDSLPDSYVRGQLNYSKARDDVFPAPNCDNKGYYTDIGICTPDNFCKRVKNPVTYALTKSRNVNRATGKGKKEKSGEKEKTDAADAKDRTDEREDDNIDSHPKDDNQNI